MPYHLTVDEISRIEEALREPPEIITPEYLTQLAVNYNTSL
jgi:hypothetical protein